MTGPRGKTMSKQSVLYGLVAVGLAVCSAGVLFAVVGARHRGSASASPRASERFSADGYRVGIASSSQGVAEDPSGVPKAAAPPETAVEDRLAQRVVVCIDPGHPSETNSGRTVQNGTTELLVNWQVALKLAAILEKQYHVRTVMTRTERDRLTTNRERANIANRAHAALFLRLHCDTGHGSGFTLYYPDRQGTKNGVTGPPVEVIAASRTAANAVHAGMAEVLKGVQRDNGVKGDSATFIGSKQGALTGSIFCRVPAVTVEMVYLSNPSDAKYIHGQPGQQQMADALARGVLRYLESQGQQVSP